MEKNSLRMEYKVGIFVATGLIVVMASILLLGGKRLVFTKYAEFSSQFNEVQGLFPGSVVSLAGLPVGNVKEIRFAGGTSKLEVVYQVDQKFRDRVTDGTTADIRTQGALGDKYVYLEPGPTTAKQIDNNATIPVSDSGDLFKMLVDKQEGVGNVLALIKELKIMMETLNGNGRTEKLMDNLVKSTDQFGKTLVQVDALITDLHGEIPDNHKLKGAIISLANILEKVDKGQGTLGQLISDPSLHQSLKAFLGGSPRNTYLKNVIRETIQQSESAKK